MNPLLLQGLLSMGPALLSRLFGDPQAELRKKVGKLTSAKNVSAETEAFLKQILSSPAFSQAQGSIATGANVAQGRLASELGARGIGTSGSAAVMSSLIPSVVGGQQATLRTGAYQSAQERAMEKIRSDIATLTGTQGPSRTGQLFAGGLEALGPILQKLLMSRTGNGGGGPIFGRDFA